MSRLRTGASGDDVWNDPVRELLDLVLQRQLALLHAREFQLIAIAGRAEQLNFFVEAPVLGLQQGQNLLRVVVVHQPVLQEARAAVTRSAVNGQPHNAPVKPMQLGSDKCVDS